MTPGVLRLMLCRGPAVALCSTSEVQGTLVGKVANRETRPGIQRVEIVPHAREEPRLAPRLVGPIHQTALAASAGARPLRRGIESPHLLARRSVQRNDLSRRRRGEQHAVDHEIVGLILAAIAGVVAPRHAKPGDVRFVDLGQPRVVGARRVAEIGRPVRAGTKRAWRRRRHRSALTRDPNRSQDARGERCRTFLVDTPQQTHGLPFATNRSR